MILIHDAIERHTECDEFGMVSERVDGYEIYEHYEKIQTRVYQSVGGRDHVLTISMEHDEMQPFVRLFEAYRDDGVARQYKRNELIQLAGEEDDLLSFYQAHRLLFAALGVGLPNFMELCKQASMPNIKLAS